MHFLAESILEVWERLGPGILGDPAEFERRLLRRRGKMFGSWPRAWCLAVKASDRRISEWYGLSRAETIYNGEGHQVCLTSALVRKLVAPVFVDRPWMEQGELARALGRGERAVRRAVEHEMFETYRRIPLLGGKRVAVPVVGTRKQLDPGWGRLPRGPHPVWGTQGQYLCDHVPEEIEQWVTRVPIWITRRRANVRGASRPRPTPDYVWYKWSKEGEYLGEPGDEKRAHRREVRAARMLEKRTLRQGSGQGGGKTTWYSEPGPQFSGFWWLCPLCGKRVRILFYPVELFVVQLLEKEFEPGHRHALPRPFDKAQDRPLKQFACERCHRMGHFSLSRRWDCWNQLITRLSDGLLYGHEVEMPKTFPLGIWEDYRVRVVPAPRRDYVRERLLEGVSPGQIAQEMKIKRGSVYYCARIIYRQAGVRTLREFLAKHGKGEPRKRDLVVERLRQGESNGEIAAATGLSRAAVSHHVRGLYRVCGMPRGVSGRRALVEAMKKTAAVAKGRGEMQKNFAPRTPRGAKSAKEGKSESELASLGVPG